jgi:hypothetical protein
MTTIVVIVVAALFIGGLIFAIYGLTQGKSAEDESVDHKTK